jgi:hypothetical protein
MNTHTTIDLSDYLFNSFTASKDSILFEINGKKHYRFIRGDSLSVIGVIKDPENQTPFFLVSVNNDFDFQEISVFDIPHFTEGADDEARAKGEGDSGSSKFFGLPSNTATAISQNAKSKIKH